MSERRTTDEPRFLDSVFGRTCDNEKPFYVFYDDHGESMGGGVWLLFDEPGRLDFWRQKNEAFGDIMVGCDSGELPRPSTVRCVMVPAEEEPHDLVEFVLNYFKGVRKALDRMEVKPRSERLYRFISGRLAEHRRMVVTKSVMDHIQPKEVQDETEDDDRTHDDDW